MPDGWLYILTCSPDERSDIRESPYAAPDIASLIRATSLLFHAIAKQDVDGRVKPGHDELGKLQPKQKFLAPRLDDQLKVRPVSTRPTERLS
jgi:hypothetical protein